MMQKFWTKFVTSDGDPKVCYVVVDDYTKHSFCQANLIDPQPTNLCFHKSSAGNDISLCLGN